LSDVTTLQVCDASSLAKTRIISFGCSASEGG
jgi:hypothetical protein